MIVSYKFDEYKLQASKRFECSKCGKKTRRQYTATETMNPYNKNKEGNPKNAREIYASLDEKLEEWRNEIKLCAKCED